MSDLENSIKETEEFIANAQEIIDKANDMVWAINKLVNKQGGKPVPARDANAAHNLAFEKALEDLMQRYLNLDLRSAHQYGLDSPSKAAPDKAAAPRPGKYRQRI